MAEGLLRHSPTVIRGQRSRGSRNGSLNRVSTTSKLALRSFFFDETFHQVEERPWSIIFLNFEKISWLWVFSYVRMLGLLLIIYV